MTPLQQNLFTSPQTFKISSSNNISADEYANRRNSKNLLEDLFSAYYSARKNKRRKNSQLAFEKHYEENIINLWEQIENRSYQPLSSTAFIKTKPVIREVFAAQFQDRIVHHYLFNALSPLFEKDFIEDSYSCRKGKGTLYGINKVQGFLKSVHHSRSNAHVLKLDIQNYFYSLDRNLLYSMILEKIDTSLFLKHSEYEKETILFLLQKVIFNDPTKNVVKKGKKEEWAKLPKSKSLFYAKPGKGLAIGNLTSQLFSNIYMNPLDHFIKEKLNIKYYGRYVDDFVIIHESKEYLKNCISKIQKFLDTFFLTIHPKKIYLQHYKKGLSFLGAYIKPFCKYTENRTKKNVYQKINKINTEILSAPNNFLPLSKKEEYRSSFNSYLGIMQNYDSFNLRKKLLRTFAPQFWNYFWYRTDASAVGIR